ncbi:MAG: hypothetical protein Q9224_007027, partial [Gallowayella concinna]
IESLEASEPHRIELLMSKNPPFGSRVLAALKDFPKLRVSVKMTGKDVKQGQSVKIRIKAELGFINIKAPTYFNRKAVNVCFLAERSDGHLMDFRRFSAAKLKNGQDILLTADLLQYTQYITCYVMCDEIAGTVRYAELNPGLPPAMFPSIPSIANQGSSASQIVGRTSNDTLKGRRKNSNVVSPATVLGDERLFDDGVEDADMFEAATHLDFCPIEAFETEHNSQITQRKAQKAQPHTDFHDETESQQWAPTQLENGKWACNHKCKDKKG